MHKKIYLLTPVEIDSEITSKLVWSSSEEEARMSIVFPAPVKLEGAPVIYRTDSVYTDPLKVKCKELYQDEYDIVQENTTVVKITYNSNTYFLSEQIPHDL